MPDEFVAIDLETTGLDRSSDRITEVGATRFNLAGEAESFQSLVDPGIPIPTMSWLSHSRNSSSSSSIWDRKLSRYIPRTQKA